MKIDTLLTLATEEVVAGAGAGGIGEDSETLAFDTGTSHDWGLGISDLGTSHLELVMDVTTSFTQAANVTLELQLISLPIALSKLTDTGSGVGKQTAITGLTVADGDDQFDVVGHNLPLAAPFYLSAGTGGTGLANNTQYFAVPDGADTFKAATSFANALAGTTVDQLSAARTGVAVQFQPYVHATTGPIPAPFLQAGNRFVARVQPGFTGPLGKSVVPTGQTVKQRYGVGPGPVLSPGRYLALRYVPSATMSTGAISANLALNAGGNLRHYPTAKEVL